jgi:sulfhydrogenase subunit gamma (sulfur reductase)
VSVRLRFGVSRGGSAARELATGQNPYLPAPARILRITALIAGTRLFELRFEDPSLAESFTYRPGQFVELSVLGVGEAPFSLPSSPTRKGTFELGIRRAGVLTGFLFDHIREGDSVGIRGPLGNGFPIDQFGGHDLLLVAGGLGMVPLRGLLQYVVDTRDRYGRVVLLYGARNPDRVLFRDELERLAQRNDAEVLLTVDDPDGRQWNGRCGVVTELVDEINVDPDSTFAIACGPPVFYKFLLEKLVDIGLGKNRIFLSLERRMECGIGKCGHCAVGYTFTCLHGPVFSYWDAINLPELIYE